MAYTRGHPGDYDRWARNGAPGWSFGEVLPISNALSHGNLVIVLEEVGKVL